MTGKATYTSIGENGKEIIITAPFHSCEWENSISNYCSYAKITLPGICSLKAHKYNPNDHSGKIRSVPVDTVIKTGMKVKIECGYNHKNDLQFSGFIVSTNIKNFRLEILCEGYSYQLRNKSVYVSLRNPTVFGMLTGFLRNTDIKLSPDIPEITLTGNVKFPAGSTGLTVLEYLKKRRLTVFFYHNVLYVGLKYKQVGSEIKYQIGWNVIKNDLLLYKENQNKYSIRLELRNDDGSKTIVTEGSGTTTKINIENIKDLPFLELLAKDISLNKNPGHYSGEIETFLKPFIKPTDTANISDTQFLERNGKYFVESVKGEFGPNGGRQKVRLAIKL